jgi:hypothetical protein
MFKMEMQQFGKIANGRWDGAVEVVLAEVPNLVDPSTFQPIPQLDL